MTKYDDNTPLYSQEDQSSSAYTSYNTQSNDSNESNESNESKLIPEGEELSDGSKKADKAFGFADIPFPVWLIVLVEIGERFSFYSLRSLLILFFKEELHMEEDWAKALYSYFNSFAYFMPILGSFLADAVLGRFLTITICTSLYRFGAYILVFAALQKSQLLTYCSLLLIGFGTGAIKPNVNVFGAQSLRTDNPQAVAAYFSIFYASINIGSVAATLGLPIICKKYGYSVAFAFPACGLTIALLIFISGYKKYVHVPPSSSLYKRMIDLFYGAYRGKKFIKNNGVDPVVVQNVLSAKTSKKDLGIADGVAPEPSLSYLPPSESSINDVDSKKNQEVIEENGQNDEEPLGEYQQKWLDYAKVYFKPEHVEQLKAVINVLPVFPFIVAFFLCFNQTSSTFLLQATKMNRVVFGFELLAPQVTALNAVSILILVPTFDRIVYPFLRRTCGMQLKHLNRVLLGLLLTATSFALSAYVEYKIEYNRDHNLPKLSILYQIPQYLLISLAELFISVCGIEFVYSQAPRAFKSTLSSFWSLCSAFADLIAGLLFTFVHLPHLWQFSLLCSGLVVLNFLLFLPVVHMFNKKTKAFYERNQQEFLNPGSSKPLPPEIDPPFAPLSEDEHHQMMFPQGDGTQYGGALIA